jgi:hypothetical protein
VTTGWCPPHMWKLQHLTFLSGADPVVLVSVRAECYACKLQVADLRRMKPNERIVDSDGEDITSQMSAVVMHHVTQKPERTDLPPLGGSSDDVCTNVGGRLRCAFEEWVESGRYYCRWCGEAARPENSEPVQWADLRSDPVRDILDRAKTMQAAAARYAIRPGPPWAAPDGHRRPQGRSEHSDGVAVDLNVSGPHGGPQRLSGQSAAVRPMWGSDPQDGTETAAHG